MTPGKTGIVRLQKDSGENYMDVDNGNDVHTYDNINIDNTASGDDELVMNIDPCQSLFDSTIHKTVQDNVKYMYQKYGFSIPDIEHCIDINGLIGYLQEKISIGHVCIYSQQIFPTAAACRQHMIDTNQTKILYEKGIDLEDIQLFYDFTITNNDFIKNESENNEDKNDAPENNDDDDDDDDNNDDDFYNDYQANVISMGFDITPLGDLVFPDGRKVGNHALRRYYQQRARRVASNAEAVLAARLEPALALTIDGSNNVNNHRTGSTLNIAMYQPNSSMLSNQGIKPGTITGRVGNGILETTTKQTTGGSSTLSPALYNQLSVYRYRAALRKQRAGLRQGQEIHQKQYNNMNKMDKKHNDLRMGNNVPQYKMHFDHKIKNK